MGALSPKALTPLRQPTAMASPSPVTPPPTLLAEPKGAYTPNAPLPPTFREVLEEMVPVDPLRGNQLANLTIGESASSSQRPFAGMALSNIPSTPGAPGGNGGTT